MRKTGTPRVGKRKYASWIHLSRKCFQSRWKSNKCCPYSKKNKELSYFIHTKSKQHNLIPTYDSRFYSWGIFYLNKHRRISLNSPVPIWYPRRSFSFEFLGYWNINTTASRPSRASKIFDTTQTREAQALKKLKFYISQSIIYIDLQVWQYHCAITSTCNTT